MIQYTDSMGNIWELNPENGYLHHPCGYITSHFYKRNNNWVVGEWGEYVPNIIKNELLTQWNNI
jgi:hypothetical protein